MIRSRPLFALAFATLATASRAGESLPADLPSNTALLVHARVSDAVASPGFALIRDVIRKAGPAAQAAFDRFAFAPQDIDSMTLVWTADAGEPLPGVAAIFRLKKSADAAKLAKMLTPRGQAEADGTWVEADLAMRPLGAKSFAIGPPGQLQRALKAPRGPLPAFRELENWNDRFLVAAGDFSKLPAEASDQIPAQVRDLLTARSAFAGIKLGDTIQLAAKLHYADVAAATKAEANLQALAKQGKELIAQQKKQVESTLAEDASTPVAAMLREYLAISQIGSLGRAEAMIDPLPATRQGNDIVASVELPAMNGGSTMVIAGAAAVGAVTVIGQRAQATFNTVGDTLPPGPGGEQRIGQGAAYRVPKNTTTNHLKQLGLAIHSYNDVNGGTMPNHAIMSKDGKPLLSWRVAVLPYLEADHIYREFKLDEPWDSDHNKKLISRMPPVFKIDGLASQPADKTHWQVFVGPGAVWQRLGKAPRNPGSFLDGTSNTIMIVEAATPVIWTKPDDLEFDAKKPLPTLGADPKRSIFYALMGDASIVALRKNAPEDSLKALITAAGQEKIDINTLAAP